MAWSKPSRAAVCLLMFLSGLLSGCYGIHRAARKGNVAALERHLARGASPNAWDWRNATPLHIAAATGQLAAVRVLVEHGADVNRRCDTPQTPVCFAAQEGHPEVVAYLLDHGARSTGVLHEAACRGRIGVAWLLLERGFDIEDEDQAGRTARQVAEMYGHVEFVRFMRSRGAQ